MGHIFRRNSLDTSVTNGYNFHRNNHRWSVAKGAWILEEITLVILPLMARNSGVNHRVLQPKMVKTYAENHDTSDKIGHECRRKSVEYFCRELALLPWKLAGYFCHNWGIDFVENHYNTSAENRALLPWKLTGYSCHNWGVNSVENHWITSAENRALLQWKLTGCSCHNRALIS